MYCTVLIYTVLKSTLLKCTVLNLTIQTVQRDVRTYKCNMVQRSYQIYKLEQTTKNMICKVREQSANLCDRVLALQRNIYTRVDCQRFNH